MLKILPLLLLTSPAFAQDYDLRSLPADYGFVSIEQDARVTVRFLRAEGDVYFFEQRVVWDDGREETIVQQVNRASQTVFFGFGEGQSTYAPHDCAPGVGTCFYTEQNNDELVEVKNIGWQVRDVIIQDEYVKSGEDWLFWNRDCTVFDEYGFWVDYVRTYWNGETEAGYREQSTPNRIDELWRMCDPAAALS